jgi:environmental stress-induced protein Ves
MSTAGPSANPVQVIRAAQVPPQPWRNGGGRTRELLAWPSSADWRLRISRADIEASGPFSAFAGVQRWFVVLSGHGVVLRMPTPDGHTLDHHLFPGHAPLHFDGGLAPFCALEDGPTLDLNLMCRAGRAGMCQVEPGQAWLPQHRQCGLYSAEAGVWSNGQHRVELAAHSLLWLEQGSATPLHFRPRDAGAARAYWLGYTPETAP